jgi:DNA-binding transcriptional ArsR family regulator
VRIHFTLTDLARTRLAGEPSRLAAATFSTFRLPHRPGPPEIDVWRRAVRSGVRNGPRDRPARPLFGGLAPTTAAQPVPGFLRPGQGLRTLDEELDRLMSTPKAALRADLEYVAGFRPLPGRARGIADGDPRVLAELAASVRDYHRVAIAPYWRGLAAAFAADRAERIRRLRDHGMEELLDTLHPRMRWRPPVLEVECVSGADYDYHLGGRGLLLAPAAFASYVPCDPAEGRPTLYYEAAHDPAHHPLLGRSGGPNPGLAALLGHSRAAVLEVIAEGVSTRQLARRVGLSDASASEHATVLRRAGLVTTRRSGRARHHTLTALGRQLLSYEGELSPEPPKEPPNA